jgi:hypothetical protein
MMSSASYAGRREMAKSRFTSARKAVCATYLTANLRTEGVCSNQGSMISLGQERVREATGRGVCRQPFPARLRTFLKTYGAILLFSFISIVTFVFMQKMSVESRAAIRLFRTGSMASIATNSHFTRGSVMSCGSNMILLEQTLRRPLTCLHHEMKTEHPSSGSGKNRDVHGSTIFVAERNP